LGFDALGKIEECEKFNDPPESNVNNLKMMR